MESLSYTLILKNITAYNKIIWSLIVLTYYINYKHLQSCSLHENNHNQSMKANCQFLLRVLFKCHMFPEVFSLSREQNETLNLSQCLLLDNLRSYISFTCKKYHGNKGNMLPGFVEGITQVLCLNSFGLNKYSHPGFKIQNSCVGSE